MTSNRPVYLSLCLSFCSLLACLSTAVHFCLITAGLIKKPLPLNVISGGVYKLLYNLWFTKIVRRMVSVLVRSPLRNSMLRLVNFTIPLPASSGCIIIICHTPWKRLLVQWCFENDFALIIAHGKWTYKKGNKLQREGKGFNELRCIIKYLKENGRIIMTADSFNNLTNCPVKFLGNYLNGGLLPTRLARIAQVPLIVAIPVFSNGTINFNHVSIFDYEMLQLDPCSVIQNFLFSLENEIKINPSVSNFYHNYI